MRFLILLLSLYVVVRGQGQLNELCNSDTDCANGVSPCIGTNCICDPLLFRCRLATNQPCTNNGNTNECNTNTICRGGRCLVTDGNTCTADTECLTNGVCLGGRCRANTGFAWDLVNNVYAACSTECATCFRPNDNTACLTCTDVSKFAYGGLCICFDGAADSTGTCQACDTTCATCAVPGTPFGCTSCALASMTFVSGVCFCPSGTAWNAMTLNCEACDPSCTTCSEPGNANYCTSCSNGIPVNGACDGGGVVTPCPNGTAQGPTGCEPCDTTCRTCLEPSNPNRCTGCYSGYKLVGGTCVPKVRKGLSKRRCSSSLMYYINGVCKCKTGYIGDSLEPNVADTYCLPCDASCCTCYAPNNPMACTSCRIGYTLAPNGTCVYGDTNGGGGTPVENCAPECQTCIVPNDNTQCLTCTAAGAIQLNGLCYCPANSFSTGGSCVSPCEAPCAQCYINNPYICTACSNGMLPLGGTCLCPNGTGLGQTNFCVPCHISCATCANGNNSAACLTCTDTRIVPVNGQCVCPDIMQINNFTGICECPGGYIEQDMTCILQSIVCSPGYYFDGTNCVLCTIPGCLNCTSATECLECQPGYYLSNGRCIACPINCLTCSSSSVCTSCAPGYTLNAQGRCVRSCPPCCPTCRYDSMGQVTCLTCLNGYVYKNNQCLACSVGIPNCQTCAGCVCTRCRAGYYKTSAGLCASCSSAIPNCELCSNANTCYRCVSPYYFDATLRRCVLRSSNGGTVPCPEGTYRNSQGVCVPCHISCRCCSTSGSYGCTKCGVNAIFKKWGSNRGMCICITGYIFDSYRHGCYPRSSVQQP